MTRIGRKRRIICAITTCPKRKIDPQFMVDLIEGGFESVTPVCDRNMRGSVWCWQEAAMMLSIMLRENIDQDDCPEPWGVILQDDVLVDPNLGWICQHIAKASLLGDVVSLYTSSRYETQAEAEFERRGRNLFLADLKLPESRRFWGACGLMMSGDALHEFAAADFGQQHGIDAVIYDRVQARRAAGCRMMLCIPSLVQHVGHKSVIDERSGPAEGWRASKLWQHRGLRMTQLGGLSYEKNPFSIEKAE